MPETQLIPQPRKAEKKRVKIKAGIQGPSGSGKTWGGLALAFNLWPNAKVCVIDSENESASLYADRWEFDDGELVVRSLANDGGHANLDRLRLPLVALLQDIVLFRPHRRDDVNGRLLYGFDERLMLGRKLRPIRPTVRAPRLRLRCALERDPHRG